MKQNGYRVGDKVRIKSLHHTEEAHNLTPGMLQVGDTGTINRIHPTSCRINDWCYSLKDLEILAKQEVLTDDNWV